MILLGADPGIHGAIALIETDTRSLMSVTDMPVLSRKVGRAERLRVSVPALHEMIETACALGCELAVIEDVAGRGNQVGGSMLGYNVGLLHMACVALNLRFETVTAAAWKRRFKLGRDKRASVDVAMRQWPDDRSQFLGQRGGYLDGRAEAALIALWGMEKHAT